MLKGGGEKRFGSAARVKAEEFEEVDSLGGWEFNHFLE